MLAKKRAASDEVRYLDLREYGNMSRLINDNQEAPNLQLLMWPPASEGRQHGRLPQRFFLFAKRDIPPLTELSWDYGDTYARPWTKKGADDDSDLSSSVSGSDDLSDATDDDVEWVKPQWAQCDECDKWRRLPEGPDHHPDVLPESWFCWLNASTHTHTCDAPEDEMARGEVYEAEEDDEMVAEETAATGSPMPEKAPADGGGAGGDGDARPRMSMMAHLDKSTEGVRGAHASVPVPIGSSYQVEQLPSPAEDGGEAPAGAPAEPEKLSAAELDEAARVATAKPPARGTTADDEGEALMSKAKSTTAPKPVAKAPAPRAATPPAPPPPPKPVAKAPVPRAATPPAPPPPPKPVAAPAPEATSTAAWAAMFKKKAS